LSPDAKFTRLVPRHLRQHVYLVQSVEGRRALRQLLLDAGWDRARLYYTLGVDIYSLGLSDGGTVRPWHVLLLSIVLGIPPKRLVERLAKGGSRGGRQVS